VCRTLGDELRRGRNPLGADAIPIYPPSTEEQPFRKSSTSRQDSSLLLGGCFSMEMGRESKGSSPSTAHLRAVVLLPPLFPRHLAQEGEKENSPASSHTSSFPLLCQGREEQEGAYGGTQPAAWGEEPNRATCTVNGWSPEWRCQVLVLWCGADRTSQPKTWQPCRLSLQLFGASGFLGTQLFP